MPELISFAELLDTLKKTVVPHLSSDIFFVTHHAHNLPPFYGDELELSEVLVNLAFNASHAMAQGGHLAVRIEAVRASEHPEIIVQMESETLIAITVDDEGTGMSAETLTKIFDPFFTTKGKAGTGLGLSAVLTSVDNHHGVLEVTSEVGQGTRFRIFLPVGALE